MAYIQPQICRYRIHALAHGERILISMRGVLRAACWEDQPQITSQLARMVDGKLLRPGVCYVHLQHAEPWQPAGGTVGGRVRSLPRHRLRCTAILSRHSK